MPPAHESLPANDPERLLSSLAGVISAHVVTDSTGRPIEIHILSEAEVHPKQVVRNVESALSAGLGIEIDRRIVSVAQVRTPVEATENGRPEEGADEAPSGTAAAGVPRGRSAAAAAGAPRNGAVKKGRGKPEVRLQPEREPSRLQYVRFESRRDAERCECEVILRDGDREVTGTGSGPDTAAGRAEAAARAVLEAIGHARNGEVRLVLEGAVISASRGRSYIIVSAHALLDRVNVALAGAAPLARSPEEAGILAALQATNRWSG